MGSGILSIVPIAFTQCHYPSLIFALVACCEHADVTIVSLKVRQPLQLKEYQHDCCRPSVTWGEGETGAAAAAAAVLGVASAP